MIELAKKLPLLPRNPNIIILRHSTMNDTDSIDKKVAYSNLLETWLYKKTYFIVSYSTIEQTI